MEDENINTLEKANQLLTKLIPIMTPAGVIIGVLFAHYLKNDSFLIPWIFAFMTFAGSLGSNFQSFKEVLKHPVPIIVALCLLHIIMPFWALGIGHLFFNGDILTITGLVLAVTIPTGITSFVWVSIYKGNIAMTLAIILIDTLLSPFVVPLTLSLFFGQNVHMDVYGIMNGLLWMVVIPSILGIILNHVTKGKIETSLGKPLAPFSKLCIGINVMLNGAVVAPYLIHVSWKLAGIGLTVFFISFTGYWICFITGRLLKNDRGTVFSLLFSGGMRNNGAGAALATAYFSPAVAVPVILCMLFQQILASTNGYFLDKYFYHEADIQKLST